VAGELTHVVAISSTFFAFAALKSEREEKRGEGNERKRMERRKRGGERGGTGRQGISERRTSFAPGLDCAVLQ